MNLSTAYLCEDCKSITEGSRRCEACASSAVYPVQRLIERRGVTKIRKKHRRGQPTPQETETVRLAVYQRSGGRCELRKVDDCISGVLAFDGPDPWSHGHLVHLRNVRMWGTSTSNCKWGCYRCHLIGIHNPKSVPAKENCAV